MKTTPKNILLLTLASLVLFPAVALAHQPRLVESTQITVPEPEVSKAYYGQLQGSPHVYRIDATEPFVLYVNVLVPDIAGQKKDVSAEIMKDGNSLAVLDGASFEWEKFYEPFGADTYWMGPEFEGSADAGQYEIRVWSANNDSKYSLAIGKLEVFDFAETMNVFKRIPQLKKEFFNTSPINFIRSPFGWGLILIMFTLSFVTGFIYRSILRKLAKNAVRRKHRNIGKSDRLLRLALSVGLLLWAITTTWSPILIFFSGFTLFEAIFSWCGFYAAIGKNSCLL